MPETDDPEITQIIAGLDDDELEQIIRDATQELKQRRERQQTQAFDVGLIDESNLPANWRPKLVPECPCCGSAAGQSVHRSGACNGDLYIDVLSGHVYCMGCRMNWEPGGDWRSHCTRCGAVFEGGELWYGMAAETVKMGNIAWMQSAGIKTGSALATILGWSSCIACGAQGNSENGYIRIGGEKGGICYACHDKASADLGKWFGGKKKGRRCSWCRSWSGSGWVKIVPVGKAFLCTECSDTFWKFRRS